jgi:hypothetical protein
VILWQRNSDVLHCMFSGPSGSALLRRPSVLRRLLVFSSRIAVDDVASLIMMTWQVLQQLLQCAWSLHVADAAVLCCSMHLHCDLWDIHLGIPHSE